MCIRDSLSDSLGVSSGAKFKEICPTKFLSDGRIWVCRLKLATMDLFCLLYTSRQALNEQRTKDYRSSDYERDGGVIDPVPEDAPQFVKEYHDYYKTERGYHPVSYTHLQAREGKFACVTE